MAQGIYSTDGLQGGKIGYDLLDFYVTTPSDGSVAGYSGFAGYWISRGYISFDTSSLPAGITIVSASLALQYYGKVTGGDDLPSGWIHTLYIGKDIIGAALDITDWGATGFKSNGDYTPNNGLITIPITSANLSNISKVGKTDFEVRDSSLASGTGGWSIVFYGSGEGRGPKLTVAYSLPRIYNAKLRNCKIYNA